MAKILTNNKHYSDIANTIRQMKEVNTTYKPREMASALKDIYSNEVEGTLPLSFESNGMSLIDYRIDGASGGVGDLITDSTDENYNKYKVPVEVSGKNLFDGTLWQGSFNSNDGTDYSSNNTVRTDYIKVKSNTTYTISINDDSDIGIRYVGYYKENEFSYDTLNVQKSVTITTPANVVSIRVVFRKEITSKLLISDVDTSKIQVEYGNTATSVDEYIEPTTTNIYLDEPLYENESISLSDTNADIPTIEGTNVLTIDTTVQPSNVYVQARKDTDEIIYLTQVLEEGI